MRARSGAALGFEPSVSDFVFSLFSRLSFFALGSTRDSSPPHYRVGERSEDTQKKGPTLVLPCVLARSDVSVTFPRLWPAAPLTVTVQGRRDSI